MNCPACGNEMTVHEFFGIEIDQCKYCGGAWFDADELSGFIRKGSVPNTLLSNVPINKETEPHQEGQRWCPRCGTHLNVEKHRDVTIDFCFRCYGVWFDNGELRQMLLTYQREAEVKKRRRQQESRISKTALKKSEEKQAQFNKFMEKPGEAPAGFWMVFGGSFNLEKELLGDSTVEDVARAIPRGSAGKAPLIGTAKQVVTAPEPSTPAKKQEEVKQETVKKEQIPDPVARRALRDFFDSFFQRVKVGMTDDRLERDF